MGRTTVEQITNSYVIVNRLTRPESINERELNAITGELLETLIPVNAEMNKKGIILKSTIAGMVSLKSYFSGLVSKKMFLNVIIQMIDIMKDAKKNLMNVNNLMLDLEYIFLEPRTKKVKCILWPIVNNQDPRPASVFFKDLPFRVIFTKHENHDYVTSYMQFFKNNMPFSLNSFEKMILEMMGKTVESKTYLPSASTHIDKNDTSVRQLEEKGGTGSIAYNPLSRKNNVAELDLPKICPKCKSITKEAARFCIDCGSPLNSVETILQQYANRVTNQGINEKINMNETTVLGNEDMDGGTTVLGADVLDEATYPYLIREKTEEKIIVNKPSFRIGKERKFCDYFVSNNNAVSRSHADIITREKRFYIIDNNSTNKTYVDNRVIPVQKEVEIFPGTKLRLANEDFVFYI